MRTHRYRNGLLIGTLASMVLVGCATDDPNRRAKTGALIGTVIGGVLGHQMDGDKGRFVGAAVGALGGAAVGGYMDKQQKEFEDALAQEKMNNELEIERVEENLLKLSLNSEVSFDFDSAMIKEAFEPSLNKLAGVLVKYDRTYVKIVGHTDSTGSEAYNQKLSLSRAQSVARILASQGVSEGRLISEGKGESDPRATNDTEAGRQLNRRVEIFVIPNVEEA